jgi:hypothetical protein
MTPPAVGRPAAEKPTGRQRVAVFGVALLALLGFGAFFVGFLLAPLAILLVFCLAFAARGRRRDRAQGDETSSPSRSRLAAEAEVRREARAREADRTPAVASPDSGPSGAADGA